MRTLEFCPSIIIAIVAIASLVGCVQSPKSEKKEAAVTQQRSNAGKYSNDLGGVTTTITIGSTTWYGEHREKYSGSLIGSGTGVVDGNKILDEYGREIGSVERGEVVYATIGGMDVTLYRE